jgi:hypothetical protein
MLASGTQDCGFAPDRSRRIFPAGKIHSMQYDTIQTTIESPIPEKCSTRNKQKHPGGGEIFRTHPDRSRGPPSLLYNGYRMVFPRGKAAGAWC